MRFLVFGLLWAMVVGTAVAQDTTPAAENSVAGTDQVVMEFGEARDVVAVGFKLEYWLDAPVDVVWDKLLEIDKWWPHTYEATSEVILEPCAGGRIYERFDDLEHGGLYGHVVYIKEHSALKADGQWALPGAAVSGGVWRLAEAAGGTLLTQTGEIIGNIDPQNMKGRETGQQMIIDAFRAYVENDQPCERYLKKLELLGAAEAAPATPEEH